MSFFSPYKRHANPFNYKPRYYDPEKEERDLRRKELRGESSEDSGEYVPGQYIRNKREARLTRLSKEKERESGLFTSARLKLWVSVVVALLLLLFVNMIYPRIVSFVEMATTSSSTQQMSRDEQEYEQFNPYAPIVIVPNDYEEGDEIEIIDEQ